MSENLLAIDIGNTRTHLGLFVEGMLEQTTALPNADLSELSAKLGAYYTEIKDLSDPVVMIASVHTEITDQCRTYLVDEFEADVMELEADANVGIGRQLDPETKTGADRLLNAAAAYDKIKETVVIVDAGTAMTVDLVDGEGTFHGGAIIPGVDAMLKAMHSSTTALPALEFAKPDEAIGHNTQQAMLTGVYHALRGAVRELVEAYATQYGAWPKVIATGGNAEVLFEDSDIVEAIVPELTLRGMQVTRHLQLNQPEE